MLLLSVTFLQEISSSNSEANASELLEDHEVHNMEVSEYSTTHFGFHFSFLLFFSLPPFPLCVADDNHPRVCLSP